jgi:hypothetical protein
LGLYLFSFSNSALRASILFASAARSTARSVCRGLQFARPSCYMKHLPEQASSGQEITAWGIFFICGASFFLACMGEELHGRAPRPTSSCLAPRCSLARSKPEPELGRRWCCAVVSTASRPRPTGSTGPRTHC